MTQAIKSSTEQEWVKQKLLPLLVVACDLFSTDKFSTGVSVEKELAYTYQIKHYDGNDSPISAKTSRYQTDALIFDRVKSPDGGALWIPRVVIECKKGAVTTHDALTYSAKAATHKHVHPHLRYGFLIASFGAKPLPSRLIKHGNNFDFIARWAEAEPSNHERKLFFEVLKEEVCAARAIEQLMEGRIQKKAMDIGMLHRPLRLLA